MWHLARALWKARGAAEAEPLFREALDAPKEVFPWGKWLRPYVLIELADMLQETGRLDEAERLKAEAADLVRGFAFQPWGCSTFAVVMVSNAQTLQAMKRYAEAESHLLEARDYLDGNPGPVRAWAHAVKSPDDYTSEAVSRRLVELYDEWSAAEPKSAAEIKAKAAHAKLPRGDWPRQMSKRDLIATRPWPREVALPARATRARIERGGPQLTGSKGKNETQEWMI
jgi:hypothetical protein